MDVRTMFSGVVVATLTLAFMPLGCGGGQEERAGVSRPLEIGTVHSSSNLREEGDFPEAIRTQLKGCVNRRAGQWSERSHAIQFDATATNHGDMVEVIVRKTTMHDDEVVECLRQAIAAMAVPEGALRPRAVRPFSGGERMTREQRGPLGSESQNPIVLLGPFVVEAIGMDVLIQVGVGIIAAVGTLVMPKKQKDECADRYAECMDTNFAKKDGPVRGTSRCAWCQRVCNDNEGLWPSVVQATVGTRSCRYPGWQAP